MFGTWILGFELQVPIRVLGISCRSQISLRRVSK